MIRRATVLALLVAGCRHGSSPSPAPGSAVTGAPVGAIPQFSDFAPGDTVDVIATMRRIMAGIDAGANTMTERDTTIGTDSLVHHLSVWLQDGVPRKLVAVDSSTASTGNVETDVWFMGGDVAVLMQPTDAYAFDGDRIVLWTDEALQPRVAVTTDVVMAKETQLIDLVRGWLAAAGVHAP